MLHDGQDVGMIGWTYTYHPGFLGQWYIVYGITRYNPFSGYFVIVVCYCSCYKDAISNTSAALRNLSNKGCTPPI